MQFHPMRILLVICIAVAALSIVLWPRSYSSGDMWTLRFWYDRGLHAESKFGQVEITLCRLDYMGPMQRTIEWQWHNSIAKSDPCRRAKNWIGCDYCCHDGSIGLIVPHWFVTTLAAAPAALVWIRRGEPFRFSLRTLFIAVTFVAVLLSLMLASR